MVDLGIEAESYTGSQAGFITDTNHTDAKILDVRADRIRSALDAGRVPVVAGAQGVSTANDVTFLGRGGSDTTAVALAKALDADACELYTDVSGVYTTDPRVVAEARKMHQVSFDELLEMTATARHARHGAVTVAARQAITMAGACEPGDVLGVVEGDFVVIGDDLYSVATEVLGLLLGGGGELVTLVTGEGATDDLARRCAAHVEEHHPHVDVVVYDGGQERYPLLVSVE